MSSYGIIPDKAITARGPAGRAFLTKGILTFHGACEHVLNLPYGRTSQRADWMLVLEEGRGTCSTKHALLASLAEELGMDVRLMLGIYFMNERNTPGAGRILQKSEFDHFPEAHCYLLYEGQRVDVTRRPGTSEPVPAFLQEQQISPAQIDEYKENVHKAFIRQWAPDENIDELWALREACIRSLSRQDL